MEIWAEKGHCTEEVAAEEAEQVPKLNHVNLCRSKLALRGRDTWQRRRRWRWRDGGHHLEGTTHININSICTWVQFIFTRFAISLQSKKVEDEATEDHLKSAQPLRQQRPHIHVTVSSTSNVAFPESSPRKAMRLIVQTNAIRF